MKKILIFTILGFIGCSSIKTNPSENPTNNEYGYSQKDPIKVGGFSEGPKNERNYLNSLSGPNGERIWFNRSGSCCQFETKNSPYGGGMLDVYKVTYEGKKDTVTLYLNMYDKATLKAPKGFVFKN
jgi:hypothetical protein